MRTLPLALLALWGLPSGVLGQSCDGLAVKASTRSKLSRGKPFTLNVRLIDQDKQHRKQAFDNSTVLQVVLPEGVYFKKAAKPLAEPAFWGHRDSALLWELGGVRKRRVQIKLGVACSCTLPQLSFGVSVARLDGHGNVVCEVSTTAQATLKARASKQALASSWGSTCVGDATGSCASTCFSCIPLSWNVVASTGQDINGVSWGTLRTPDGIGYVYNIVPISDTTSPPAPEVPPLNSPYDSSWRAARALSFRKPDIPTLQHFASSGRTFIINDMEDYPSTMYLTEVIVNPTTGLLTMTSARAFPAPAPDSPWWFLCAGSLTPWGTKLVGEEFPPDARIPDDERFDVTDGNNEETATNAMLQVRAFGYYNDGPDYFGVPPIPAGAALPVPFPSKGDISTNATLKLEAAASLKPYNYGATGEVAIDADGSTTILRKLWTIGRISHELTVVLPDRRTVISTDDADMNGAVIMFIADQAGDLTSGTLYAAKFANQKPPLDPVTGAGAEWDVEWVELGHATQAELEAMRPTLHFSDIFDTADATVTGTTLTCPGGFARVNSEHWKVQPGNFRAECLRVRAGMEKAAAFFETRRYAGLMGATTEFTKAEGIAYSVELGTVYVATARINNGMRDGAIPIGGYPYVYDISAERNDIRLPVNQCGGVIEMDVSPGSWTPVRARMAITGEAGGDAENSCNPDRIAGPDNLFFVPGTSTLLIAEDPGSGQHLNAMLWAVDVLANRPPLRGAPWPVNPQMTRIMTAPVGSEITGPNTGEVSTYGWTYLMVAVQNPEIGPAPIGYIGPIPSTAIPTVRAKRPQGPPAANSLARLEFSPVPVPQGFVDQNRVVATERVCVW